MKEILVSFKSGHYKKIRGAWKGDSVWGHFVKPDGTEIHINKDEVEYIQVSDAIPEYPIGGIARNKVVYDPNLAKQAMRQEDACNSEEQCEAPQRRLY